MSCPFCWFLLFLKVSPQINLMCSVSEIGSNHSVEKKPFSLSSTFTLGKPLWTSKSIQLTLLGLKSSNSCRIQGKGLVFSLRRIQLIGHFTESVPLFSPHKIRNILVLLHLCFLLWLCRPENQDLFQVNCKKFTHISSVLNDS